MSEISMIAQTTTDSDQNCEFRISTVPAVIFRLAKLPIESESEGRGEKEKLFVVPEPDVERDLS